MIFKLGGGYEVIIVKQHESKDDIEDKASDDNLKELLTNKIQSIIDSHVASDSFSVPCTYKFGLDYERGTEFKKKEMNTTIPLRKEAQFNIKIQNNEVLVNAVLEDHYSKKLISEEFVLGSIDDNKFHCYC